MRYIIIALMLIMPSVALAGSSYNQALFSNVTGTETLTGNTMGVLCFDGASVLVVMGNFTGTVAVQASVDGGTTYQTYTTVPQNGGTVVYNFTPQLVPTHIKVVPTDTFIADTSRGGVSAHISIRQCY